MFTPTLELRGQPAMTVHLNVVPIAVAAALRRLLAVPVDEPLHPLYRLRALPQLWTRTHNYFSSSDREPRRILRLSIHRSASTRNR